MEENSSKKRTYQVVNMPENETKKQKSNHTFSKNVLLPFCSGIIGATLVIGACVFVPRNSWYSFSKYKICGNFSNF